MVYTVHHLETILDGFQRRWKADARELGRCKTTDARDWIQMEGEGTSGQSLDIFRVRPRLCIAVCVRVCVAVCAKLGREWDEES